MPVCRILILYSQEYLQKFPIFSNSKLHPKGDPWSTLWNVQNSYIAASKSASVEFENTSTVGPEILTHFNGINRMQPYFLYLFTVYYLYLFSSHLLKENAPRILAWYLSDWETNMWPSLCRPILTSVRGHSNQWMRFNKFRACFIWWIKYVRHSYITSTQWDE